MANQGVNLNISVTDSTKTTQSPVTPVQPVQPTPALTADSEGLQPATAEEVAAVLNPPGSSVSQAEIDKSLHKPYQSTDIVNAELVTEMPAGEKPPVLSPETGVTTAAALTSTVAPLIATVSAVASILGALVGTVKVLDSVFQDLTRRASEYSGDVAISAEIAETRVMFAEMRRAFQLEKGLSQFASSRGDLSVQLTELSTLVSETLLPYVIEGTSHLSDAVKGINKIYTFLDRIIPDLPKGLIEAVVRYGVFGPIVNLLALIGKNTKKDEEKDVMGDYIDDWKAFINPENFNPPQNPGLGPNVNTFKAKKFT